MVTDLTTKITITRDQINAMKRAEYCAFHLSWQNDESYIVVQHHDDTTTIYPLEPSLCLTTDYRTETPSFKERHTFVGRQYDAEWQSVLRFLRSGDEVGVSFTIANNSDRVNAARLNLCTANINVRRGNKRFTFMVAANAISYDSIALAQGVHL